MTTHRSAARNSANRLKTVRRAVLTLAAITWAGCSITSGAPSNIPTSSIQTLEYYPHLVKGYQNSFPPRRWLILIAVDSRDLRDIKPEDSAPLGGNPSIGLTLDQNKNVIQRLYSAPLGPIVQKALELSASEAGLVALNGASSEYKSQKEMGEDYVLETRITKCWVKKRRGPDGRNGPTWFTNADFTIDATVYKPPFRTPFWQGRSPATYDDPPINASPEDDTGIYDEPGQVLSIALTRAVAGIFQQSDLRMLITEDQLTAPSS
jgi:hypothetical protein